MGVATQVSVTEHALVRCLHQSLLPSPHSSSSPSFRSACLACLTCASTAFNLSPAPQALSTHAVHAAGCPYLPCPALPAPALSCPPLPSSSHPCPPLPSRALPPPCPACPSPALPSPAPPCPSPALPCPSPDAAQAAERSCARYLAAGLLPSSDSAWPLLSLTLGGRAAAEMGPAPPPDGSPSCVRRRPCCSASLAARRVRQWEKRGGCFEGWGKTLALESKTQSWQSSSIARIQQSAPTTNAADSGGRASQTSACAISTVSVRLILCLCNPLALSRLTTQCCHAA